MTLCVTFHLNIRNARNEKGLLKREDWYTGNLVADILAFILQKCSRFNIHFKQTKKKFFNLSSFFNFKKNLLLWSCEDITVLLVINV